MADIKITDLVDQKVFDDLDKLSQGIKDAKQAYLDAAQQLAKGLNLKVSVTGDIDKLNEVLAAGAEKARKATEQLNTTIEQQRKIIVQTTPVISRELAEIEKENKAKREAFQQDKDALSIAESLIGSRHNNIVRLAQLKGELNKVNAEQRALDHAVKAGALSEQAANKQRADIITRQRELKAAMQELNVVLNNQDKQMIAAEGSYKQLSLQLELMKKAYKELTDEEKASPMGQKLEAEIQNMDAHLKDLAADMGEFQRNVGNYAIANQNVRTELRDLVQQIAMLTLQYRAMSDEEKNSASGQEMAQHIQTMTERAAQLKDVVADVNREVQAGANDTANFSAISEGVQLLIDGFGAATGAAKLLGLSEKSLVEIQTNLQAAYVTSNSLVKIQNTLQKESNLMKGVARLQEAAHAKAINIKTAAEGRGIVVTKAATVAQAALNLVAKMNPYLLLATGIAVVIALAIKFTKITKEETEAEKAEREEAERLKKEFEDLTNVKKQLAEAQEDGMKSSADEIAQLNLLYTAATNQSRSTEERLKAVKKLKEQYPSYLQNMKDEEIIVGNAADAYQRLADAIVAKAIAESMLDKVKGVASKYAEVVVELKKTEAEWERVSQQHDEIVKAEEAAAKKQQEDWLNGQQEFVEVSDATFNAHAETIKEVTRQADDCNYELLMKNRERLSQQKEEFERTMREMVGAISINDLFATTSGDGPANNMAKGIGKTLADIQLAVMKAEKEILATRIKFANEGSEHELMLTKESINLETKIKKKELDKQHAADLKSLQASLNEKKISEDEYNAYLQVLNDQYAQQIEQIEEDAVKSKEDAHNKYIDAYIEQEEKKCQEELEAMEVMLLKETAELTQQRADRLITEEEYQKKLADLQLQYARETAIKQIEMLEKVLESEELTADQRAALEKELAKLKAQAAKDAADAAKDAIDDVEDAEEDADGKKRGRIKKMLRLVSQSIGKINGLVQRLADNELAAVEKQSEANEEKYEKDVERIEALEEIGAISSEEAEARKRAAKEQSEQREEELEKKKQEIKYKAAVWDKATSVAQAGINTALGITQALASTPWPLNIVMAALVGAMGAVEVATILATPIAAYAKGTDKDGHPGGLAVVGDGGKHEAVVFGDKMWITPDTPTLVDMPKGTMVYPDADNLPEPLMQSLIMSKDNKPFVIVHHDSKKLEHSMDKNNRLLQRAIISNERAQYNQAYQAYKARL